MRSIYNNNNFDAFIIITYFLLLCFLLKGLIVNKNVRKWQNYILVSINDIELEYRKAKKLR
jgi:hypothetical protein